MSDDRPHTLDWHTKQFISCTCGWQSLTGENANDLYRQWWAHIGIDLETVKKRDAELVAEARARRRPASGDIFTKRGISKEIKKRRPYIPWTTDYLDPVHEAYSSLGTAGLNFALRIAG